MNTSFHFPAFFSANILFRNFLNAFSLFLGTSGTNLTESTYGFKSIIDLQDGEMAHVRWQPGWSFFICRAKVVA
jgi:hypothetical protein